MTGGHFGALRVTELSLREPLPAARPMRNILYLLLLFLSAPSTSRANGGYSLVLTGGMELLSRGDLAWYSGDRVAAHRLYRLVLDSEDPAARAMARLRLLHFSGNLGMLVHGPRADRDLASCTEGPWCLLAWADYNLLAPHEVGAEPAMARGLALRAMGQLPGPSRARLYLATGNEEHLRALEAVPRDGLGEGLLLTGGRAPPGPGTCFLGLGILAAPGLGVGGALELVQPDLGRRGYYLRAEASGNSRGSLGTVFQLAGPGQWHGLGLFSMYRLVVDLYDFDTSGSFQVDTDHDGTVEYSEASAMLGSGVRWRSHMFRAGTLFRMDWLEGMDLSAPGLLSYWAYDVRRGWGSDRRGTFAMVYMEGAARRWGSAYDHLGVQGDFRIFLEAPMRSVLAVRTTARAVLLTDVPFFLFPSAGGAEILRGAPAGRYRGAQLLSLDMEWRHMLWGPLETVLFLDGAWVDGTGAHPGGGMGLRLILPPRELNVARLDFAVGDAGWALSAGWGEAF